jgi:hypothetical protein
MDGPLGVVMGFSRPLDLATGLMVGLGFGFVLERAGFGRADNLTAIFYGRDFRVLRVMFTAIVTGMLGLYFMDLVGFMPLSSIGLLDTYLLPQLVGGLLLGVGFIIGGYCPGTSLVASASGKVDGLLFLVGLVLGSAVFTLGFDSFAPLQKATAMGRVLIHEYLGVPAGVVVLGVALMAVGAFAAVAVVERWVNGHGGEAQP